MAFGRAHRRHRKGGSTMALAGAGFIAVVHALAAKDAGITVRSVASAGGRSARHLAGELDARRCSVDQLPDGADLLVVATPPPSHVDLAIAGLAEGAAVLVEKPIAPTLSEADRLLAAVAATPGARITVGENLLHAPAWRAFSSFRPSLGTLGHLSVQTLQPAPDWGHFASPLVDGGVLYDLGPHAIALAIAVAGEPVVAVEATLSSERDDGADDAAKVDLRFGSGLRASVEVSWRSPEAVWQLQAASETGVLRLELLPDVLLEHNGEPVTVADRHDATDPSIERFGYLDQLLDAVSPEPTGQSVAAARTVLDVICCAYASARSGAEVPHPFTGDRSKSPMQLWKG